MNLTFWAVWVSWPSCHPCPGLITMSASDWEPLEHYPSVDLSSPLCLGASLSQKTLDDSDDNDKNKDDNRALGAKNAGG